MSVIHLRRMGQLPDPLSDPSPVRGHSFSRDIPNDGSGIKFEIGRMVRYVRDSRKDPVIVRTARMVAQICKAKDKKCEMAAMFQWAKNHFRYVNDQVEGEAIQTPAAQIAEINTPGDVINAILGPDLVQQMSGFGVAGRTLQLPNQIACASCFRKNLSGPELIGKTNGDCDEGATFLSSMLAAIGITPRFRFGGSAEGADGANWHHVWVQGLTEAGDWVDMDITEDDAKLGWSYPGFQRLGYVNIFE